MGFLFPLLYFVLANGLLVMISKKSFGRCIPITMMLNAFVYFFSQVIFHTFKVGFVINILFAVIFIILIINMKIKNKDFTILKERFFSKGFYAFLVAYVAIYIFDLNRVFSHWDEFSHWGEMIKEMMRLDRFYSVNASTLMAHKDYPPIMQLLELFYCNIAGRYEEAYLIRCMHLFCFTMFIPIFTDNKKFNKVNTILKSLLVLAIVFLTFLFFDQHGIINTIYNDYLMVIVVAYLIFEIIFTKKPLGNFNLFVLSIGCSFLILTKQIALTLYLMVLFMFVVDLVLKYKKNKLKIDNSNITYVILKVLVLLIVIPLLFWKGWGMYVEKLDLEQQFKLSDIKISDIYGILHGTSGKKYQIETASNYINTIKTSNLTTSEIIKLSYLQCFALFILLLYLIWLYGKKYFSKEKMFLLAVTLSIGLVGYAFVMLVTYVFSFGPREGPILASFNRYIPTYILICMSILVMLFVFIESKKDENNKSLRNIFLLFLVLFIIQSPNSGVSYFPELTRKPDSIYKYHADIIKKKTNSKAKIFIIAQNTSGEYQYFTKYYMNARITNLKKYNLPIEKIKNYEEYFDKKVNDYMLKYDYLYLASIDNNFINKYSFIFPNNDIKETNLYKIENYNGKVKLILED